ncbi:efflux RND transporter periplasmic adaptor subunit [Sediminibacterium soli]|uniref:efflux RND transporter periplasmic adaptor subunit n=1 Tax=Sediminibacterium soli TaxID=2698829 RepID=UPI00192A225A|nr:efflux RND transporter periplasmic adaptor subunit [Sediminibacterium soli]
MATTFLYSCSQNKASDNNPPDYTVPVISIVEKNVNLDKIYVSDIQAVQNVELRSRIPGFLDRIYVDEGQTVQKGQLLFSISNEEYRAQVAQAKASLNSVIADGKTAELEMERIRLLVDKKILSSTELALAQAKLRFAKAKIEEAQAALDHAHTRLSYTSVRAPYDGVLDRIPLKVGSLLEEGTLLTSVSDIGSVYAYFNVSENEYLDYLREKQQKGTTDKEVSLLLADGQEYPLPGKIETVVSEFEQATGSIAFRARFPNPHRLLKHKATGKVCLSRNVEKALMLPQKSVFEIQDRNYVYVVDAGNTVRMKSFVPRARFEKFYVVSSGLSKGEKVVYEGIQNIKEGMQVRPAVVAIDSLLTKNIF